MDNIIVLGEFEANQLLNELRAQADRNVNFGLRKLSVAIDGEGVKFKINEHMWSPPMGKKREDG